METKNNSSRTLAILAAVVAVVALGIGFAAYTRALYVNNTVVTLNPVSNLDVHFVVPVDGSGYEPTCETGNASGYQAGSTTAATVNYGTVSATSITGFSAVLGAPGDWAQCTYRILNESQYVAYLNELAFGAMVTCSGTNGTAACPYVKATVTTNGVTVTNTSTTLGSNTAISGKSWGRGATKDLVLKVEFLETAGADSVSTNFASGNFTVTPGNVSFKFDTTD